jgi:hypothetical protein
MVSKKFQFSLILQAFIWIIPVSIYVIGDWMGSGIHWLVFRYQQTNMGNSFIVINRETGFFLSNIITGKGAVSIIVWDVGASLIFIATLMMCYAVVKDHEQTVKRAAVCNIAGALVLTLSMVILYGITLNGPAGFAIPFGIPVIIIIAYLQYSGMITSLFPENKPETG